LLTRLFLLPARLTRYSLRCILIVRVSSIEAKSACLELLGLSITEGAKILGVTRQTLTKIVNGKSGISAEMAIRLTKAFGSSAETLVRMQASYASCTGAEEREQNQGPASARSA
jgi:addiction module HigA family antidote